MMTDMKQLIEKLDYEWGSEGFLGNVRNGQFSHESGASFLSILRGIRIEENDEVPKRLLSLLWYLPTFLAWQRKRIEAGRADIVAYDRFSTEVHNILEEVLGVP